MSQCILGQKIKPFFLTIIIILMIIQLPIASAENNPEDNLNFNINATSNSSLVYTENGFYITRPEIAKPSYFLSNSGSSAGTFFCDISTKTETFLIQNVARMIPTFTTIQ